MDDYSVHAVPDQLKDEDKWFGFTKRQWFIFIPGILIVLAICFFFNGLGMLGVGVFISTIIAAIDIFIAFYTITDDKYMFGCGKNIEIIVIRIIRKKFPKNKVLFTKNVDKEISSWGKPKKK